MRIKMTLVGTSALLMHNAQQLTNPQSKVAQAIAELTDKRDKTAQDHDEIARLEFYGGMYIAQDGSCPVVPAPNVRKTFINAAKVRREGRTVERALIPTAAEFPLQYKGPRDVAELWKDESFRFLTPVRVGAARIMRMRPRFNNWSLECDWELLESIMDFKKLVRVGNEAGLIEGLCDGRVQGWGRFICEITQVQETRSTA